MSETPENPPAFPVVIPDGCGGFQYADNGMTLRDWFAGQALGGFAASPHARAGWRDDQVARSSYEVADAMLTARGETPRG